MKYSNTAHAMKVDASACSSQQEIASVEGQLQAFCYLDTLGIKEDEGLVYDKFIESVSFQDGCYCVCLPWRLPRAMLSDNRQLPPNLLKRRWQTSHNLMRSFKIRSDEA